ncbi:MAG: hypothetical protein H0T55_03150 [Rubrobacteraceae bacterium]|nr:hypothetical protein [Rubrobacteraceae bacterium]
MYPQRMVRQALRLGLLVALVVLALSACGGGEKEAKARSLPEDPQALRPGEYRSEEFKPSLSFKVGKGWSSAPLEASDELQITRGQTAGLGFLNVQEVYKPTRMGTPNVVDAPKDMAGWLQQHPYLQTSNPEPVTVGGVKGVQFDVVVGDRPQYYIPICTSIVGTPNCVDLFRLSTGGPILLVEGDKAGVIVLEDVEGETVTIGFYSPASEFGELAPEAQKVLESVEWRGS